ncbi:MAG: anthranilate synthase component I [Chloroflexi bacterium]|nr:anthranilate synthase component I [Chloroflexota bacterium]
MYQPDVDTFQRHSQQGKMVPIFREWPADLETPVSVFLKLRRAAPAFLLESVERGEQLGRYSFIGASPSRSLECSLTEAVVRSRGNQERVRLALSGGPDPLHVLERLLGQSAPNGVAKVAGLPRFFGGAVGYMGYDLVRFFEKLPPYAKDELGLPDAFFLFTDTVVIFDHIQHKMKVVTQVPAGAGSSAYQEAVDRIDAVILKLEKPLPRAERVPRTPQPPTMPPELVSNFTQAQFEDIVRRCQEYIKAGDIFQVVPSRRVSRATTASAFAIYRSLRMLNPSPYMFYFDFGPFQLIGSSPEMLVRLQEGMAETHPIAGTRPRGATEAEDEALIADLLADPKERAEHVMLVDLGRNDIGRVSRYGTVRVPVFMSTEKYSHVIHIVSSVRGELQPEYNAFSLLRACFPAGTVSGAPKIRAMEIINEMEGTKRGPYAGAVGYFGFGGNMDTCITIRAILKMGDKVYFQAGGGIVADSDPATEYQETWNKMAGMDKAVRLAESGGI